MMWFISFSRASTKPYHQCRLYCLNHDCLFSKLYFMKRPYSSQLHSAFLYHFDSFYPTKMTPVIRALHQIPINILYIKTL